jgi:hypothetical protein
MPNFAPPLTAGKRLDPSHLFVSDFPKLFLHVFPPIRSYKQNQLLHPYKQYPKTNFGCIAFKQIVINSRIKKKQIASNLSIS